MRHFALSLNASRKRATRPASFCWESPFVRRVARHATESASAARITKTWPRRDEFRPHRAQRPAYVSWKPSPHTSHAGPPAPAACASKRPPLVGPSSVPDHPRRTFRATAVFPSNVLAAGGPPARNPGAQRVAAARASRTFPRVSARDRVQRSTIEAPEALAYLRRVTVESRAGAVEAVRTRDAGRVGSI